MQRRRETRRGKAKGMMSSCKEEREGIGGEGGKGLGVGREKFGLYGSGLRELLMFKKLN